MIEQFIAIRGYTYLLEAGNLYRVQPSYRGGYMATCVSSSRTGRGKTPRAAARDAARRYRSTAPEPRLPEWARPLERVAIGERHEMVG